MRSVIVGLAYNVLFGNKACFFPGYVGEERHFVKTDKNIKLTEVNFVYDVDALASIGDVVLCEAE